MGRGACRGRVGEHIGEGRGAYKGRPGRGAYRGWVGEHIGDGSGSI